MIGIRLLVFGHIKFLEVVHAVARCEESNDVIDETLDCCFHYACSLLVKQIQMEKDTEIRLWCVFFSIKYRQLEVGS